MIERCQLSLYRTEMPKQRATSRKVSCPCESTSVVTRCTRSSAARTGDVPSSTQQRRGPHRTPLTHDIIPALIQEVIQSRSRTDPHSHDDPPRENTTLQLTQTNATVQGAPPPANPVTNNTLTTEDIPNLVQQVLRALPEDRHPLQSIPPLPDQAPTPSELFAVHVVGIIGNLQCIATMYITTLLAGMVGCAQYKYILDRC